MPNGNEVNLQDRLALRLRVDTAEVPLLKDVVNEATKLVEAYKGKDTPPEIVNLAILEVGAELWARRDSKGGIIASFQDGPVTRLARDPMVAAYPILSPWKGPQFA